MPITSSIELCRSAYLNHTIYIPFVKNNYGIIINDYSYIFFSIDLAIETHINFME